MLVGVSIPPSLIPTLWNIGILQYKQAKMCKDLQLSVPEILDMRLACWALNSQNVLVYLLLACHNYVFPANVFSPPHLVEFYSIWSKERKLIGSPTILKSVPLHYLMNFTMSLTFDLKKSLILGDLLEVHLFLEKDVVSMGEIPMDARLEIWTPILMERVAQEVCTAWIV